MDQFGELYRVGYSVAKVTTLWTVARKLSAIGCKDETLSELLSIPCCCVNAAHNLGTRHDTEATAVLLDIIRCIVAESYHECIDENEILAIAGQECLVAKSLITQPEILPS